MATKPGVLRYAGGQRLICLDEMDPTRPAVQKALELRARLFTGRGGTDRLSAIKKNSIDIYACVTTMVEDLLTRGMNGGEIVDLSALNSLLNSRRREAELIGVDPAPIGVTPKLSDYLENKK
jgi:hypothetical protein